ncbi:hypothetical protein BC830DRAFT_1228677 [Chytriomyces sp. MP71]|nr:hypothetical protein BC830DRAFT_1228677 [Chytriomyces sp. MP71]
MSSQWSLGSAPHQPQQRLIRSNHLAHQQQQQLDILIPKQVPQTPNPAMDNFISLAISVSAPSPQATTSISYSSCSCGGCVGCQESAESLSTMASETEIPGTVTQPALSVRGRSRCTGTLAIFTSFFETAAPPSIPGSRDFFVFFSPSCRKFSEPS